MHVRVRRPVRGKGRLVVTFVARRHHHDHARVGRFLHRVHENLLIDVGAEAHVDHIGAPHLDRVAQAGRDILPRRVTEVVLVPQRQDGRFVGDPVHARVVLVGTDDGGDAGAVPRRIVERVRLLVVGEILAERRNVRSVELSMVPVEARVENADGDALAGRPQGIGVLRADHAQEIVLVEFSRLEVRQGIGSGRRGRGVARSRTWAAAATAAAPRQDGDDEDKQTTRKGTPQNGPSNYAGTCRSRVDRPKPSIACAQHRLVEGVATTAGICRAAVARVWLGARIGRGQLRPASGHPHPARSPAVSSHGRRPTPARMPRQNASVAFTPAANPGPASASWPGCRRIIIQLDRSTPDSTVVR